MKIAIIGLPGAGRSTITGALTSGQDIAKRGGKRIASVQVDDNRVNVLTEMYHPQKTTFARVEYLLTDNTAGGGGQSEMWTEARNCDALIMVVRNFTNGVPADPAGDMSKLESEMIFSDYTILEKRAEKLNHEKDRGKKVDEEELGLITTSLECLEKDVPLRTIPETAHDPLLKSFGLLSAKPILYLFNNAEADDALPELTGSLDLADSMTIQGMIENELAGMEADEAAEFLSEYGIEESALSRIVRRSYDLLGMISFFTVGEDEVRAWTIERDTEAQDAAEVIHSDIKKGFIRAETVGYDDLVTAGDLNTAKKQAKLRLEGRTYVVEDGDVISFRFNV